MSDTTSSQPLTVEELREQIAADWLWITHTCTKGEQESVERTLDKMIALFQAQAALQVREARIDELKHCKTHNMIAGNLVHRVDRRLKQLAQPQEGKKEQADV